MADATTLPAPARDLPIGVYVQTYRAKIEGATHQARLDTAAHKLDALQAACVRGVFFHGFTTEMTPDVFGDWAKLATDRGLLACAAFGLDATDPRGKGQRMAAVAKHPACSAVAVDAEGAWDVHAQAGALAMAAAFRAAAPDALVLDQSWPVPTMHSAFPYEQFAGFVDAHNAYVEFVDLHAEQRYCNDWTRQWGHARYAKCEALFEQSEAKLDTILPAIARRPHIRTIQGAGWADIPNDLRACLTAHPTCLVWSEPFPDDAFMRVLAEPRP